MSQRKPEELKNTLFQSPEVMEYRGICKHVVDGDTFDFFMDLGLYQYAYVTVRLKDVDTPEIYGSDAKEEKVEGYKVKALVEELILNKSCLLRTYKDRQTFGRFVADVLFYENGEIKNLAEVLKAYKI